jgi:UDP-glucose 4-epimerase
MSHPKRVLVTGGAGFIGSHLVEALVARGDRVTVIDNLATGKRENLAQVAGAITWVEHSVTDLLTAGELDVAAYDIIFHLAANPYIPPSVEKPSFDYALNLHTTFLLLEALRLAPSRPILVNTSSAAVYGNPASLPIRETDPTVPISPYGVSKLAAERYVAVFSALYGLPAVSARLFSVYGPRQRKQVVFDLLTRLRADPAHLEVLGDGSQARDFCYVGDTVQALLLMAENAPRQGEAYNVAQGRTHTIADLVQALVQVCGLQPAIHWTGSIRPGDAERWEVDIARLSTLGYTAQYTLPAGLAAIRDWFDSLPTPPVPAYASSP